MRSGFAPHPVGTEVDPEEWWVALNRAVTSAGGLSDVAAVAVAGQQHGLVALDATGRVIRPALLWNDLRSAGSAADLIADLGEGDPDLGAVRWASATGLVPSASFTVSKLRWLADHEPDLAARISAIVLPHDWLSWRLAGSGDITRLTTDRSEASGTGYYDSVGGAYRRDLIALALRMDERAIARIILPRVVHSWEATGRADYGASFRHVRIAAGMGDNAAAALSLGLSPGGTFLSLGTSGVVATVSEVRANDPSGLVSGFADAGGHYLNIAVTLNAARILDATARILQVDHGALSRLALDAPPGSLGLTYIPYLEGERTPNLPLATATLYGITQRSMTREAIARATVEGLLSHMAHATRLVRSHGAQISSIVLIGGAARSLAVRKIAPTILGIPVSVPEPSEYVADGAALQAAWLLSKKIIPPRWPRSQSEVYTGEPRADILQNYLNVAARASAE